MARRRLRPPAHNKWTVIWKWTVWVTLEQHGPVSLPSVTVVVARPGYNSGRELQWNLIPTVSGSKSLNVLKGYLTFLSNNHLRILPGILFVVSSSNFVILYRCVKNRITSRSSEWLYKFMYRLFYDFFLTGQIFSVHAKTDIWYNTFLSPH